MKGSIEEKMNGYQDAKAKLGKGAMSRLTREEERAARVPLMLDLFGVKARQSSFGDDEDDEELDWIE